MPELPEVENIRQELAGILKGQCFKQVVIMDKEVVRKPSPEMLAQQLPGLKIKELSRRGKYLLFQLEGGLKLIFHFKMTGLLLVKATEEYPPGTRVLFELKNLRLFFVDRRRLGGLWLVAEQNEVIGTLGPEPLEEGFSAETLKTVFKDRKAPVKRVLMDQKAIAGIGNMYADEALFLAKINPFKRASELTPVETERLAQAIKKVLIQAIKAKGASVDTYLLPSGEPGRSQIYFQVAHRKGSPCPVCSTPIKRLPLNGRGSYFCPHCQPLG